MMPSLKSLEYLCEITTVENVVGRERERGREEQISGVREGALLRNGNGMGWKWPFVKKDT
jgi:hypothetical protein